jgi:hypothetical protein
MILFVIDKTFNNINSAEIAPEDSMCWFPGLTPYWGTSTFLLPDGLVM